MQFRATEGTASTGKPVLKQINFLTKSRQKVYARNTQNVVKFFPKQESQHTKMRDSATIHVSFAKHTCPFCKLHTCKWAFSLVEMGVFDVLFQCFYCFFTPRKTQSPDYQMAAKHRKIHSFQQSVLRKKKNGFSPCKIRTKDFTFRLT